MKNPKHFFIGMAFLAASLVIFIYCVFKALIGFHLLSPEVFLGIFIVFVTMLLVRCQDGIKRYIIRYMIPFQVYNDDIPKPPKRLVQFSDLYVNTVVSCIFVGIGGSAVAAFWRGGYTPPSEEMKAIMGGTISILVVMQFSLVSSWIIIRAMRSFEKRERKTLLKLYIIGKNYVLRKSTKGKK
jgi:hypothetical protein